MTTYYCDKDLRPMVRQIVAGFPSMRAAADALGIEVSYLSRVLSGTRPVGAKLAHLLGFAPQQVYVQVRKAGRPLHTETPHGQL